ncbi:hypothetical protein FQZ97_883170 [compost metagenome]
MALQGAQVHAEALGDALLARQAVLQQLAQCIADLLWKRLVAIQFGDERRGMFFQGAQQIGIGLAQRLGEQFQRHQQRVAGLPEAHRAAEQPLVLANIHVRLSMLEPDFPRRRLAVGDPARVQQPGCQHVFHHVPADFTRPVAAIPDQSNVVVVRLQTAYAHVADEFFVRHDARHRLAEIGAVHGDVAEHAPRAGLHELCGAKAEQRIAGALAELAEQAFVGLAGQALAVVVELGAGQADGLEDDVDIHAEALGMAQIAMQGGNGGLAEAMHSSCVPIGNSCCPDPPVTGAGGWLV